MYLVSSKMLLLNFTGNDLSPLHACQAKLSSANYIEWWADSFWSQQMISCFRHQTTVLLIIGGDFHIFRLYLCVANEAKMNVWNCYGFRNKYISEPSYQKLEGSRFGRQSFKGFNPEIEVSFYKYLWKLYSISAKNSAGQRVICNIEWVQGAYSVLYGFSGLLPMLTESVSWMRQNREKKRPVFLTNRWLRGRPLCSIFSLYLIHSYTHTL